MGGLQFNRKTMPLRKNRSARWGASNGFCQVRRLCFISLVVGTVMVGLALYIDQEMVRNLNTTTQTTPLIRKPVEYLTKMAMDGYDGNAPRADLDTASATSKWEDEKAKTTKDNVDQTLSIEDQDNNVPVDSDEAKKEAVVENTPSVPQSSIMDVDQTLLAMADQISIKEIEMSEVPVDVKPRLFLHVGPQKTGSSTLQSALDIMSSLTYRLGGDNLTYRHITPEEGDFDCELGPWGGFVNCVVSEKLKKILSDTRKSGQNLLLTDENLGDRFVAPLRAAISDEEWNVTVIVMYRRIHEWLVSWYNQINKTTNLDSGGNILVDKNGTPYREEHKNWPDKGGVYVPEFSTWYKDYIKYWDPSDLPSKHRSVEYFKLYEEAFKDVVVFDMHKTNDFVASFFCDILLASQACQKLRNKEIDLSEVNASINLDHDILATFFYDQGLIDKSLSRKDVISSVSSFIGTSGKSIPRSCDAEILNQIFEWLVSSEKIMIKSEWSDESEGALKTVFEKYLAKGRLCDLDREAVLKDEEWRSFFQTLEGRNDNAISNKDGIGEEPIIDIEVVVEEPSKNGPKRHFVIHIGASVSPVKDINTSLDAMDKEGQGLASVDYRVLSFDPFDGYFNCVDDVEDENEVCEATETFFDMVSSVEADDKNLYLIMECLDGRLPVALRRAIDDDRWDVKVVVSYTRLHEMIHQLYASYIARQHETADETWPQDGGNSPLSFNSWYSVYTREWKTSNIGEFHLSIHLLRRYASNFGLVTLSDSYAGSNPIENFICISIPDADRACKSFNATNHLELTRYDASESAWTLGEADILAVAAVENGLVPIDRSRQSVAESVRRKIRSMHDKALPRLCHTDEMGRLFEWEIESEKIALASDWRPKRISSITSDFQEFLKSGKLCDIDVEKALQDNDWVHFFASL